MDEFFGTPEWRDIWKRRLSSEESDLMMSELLSLYGQQLVSLGLVHVDRVRKIYRKGEAGLYSMLFASAKPVAIKLAGWEMATVDSQLGLFAG